MAIGTPTSLGFNQTAASGTTVVLTTTAASAAGNTIIVPCHVGSATVTITGVTDSVGNTYTKDNELLPATNQHIYIFRCSNASALGSGGTITVTISSSSTAQRAIHAISVSGLATSSAKDTSSTNEATSAVWTSGSTGTLAQNEELAVALAYVNSATANTADGSWPETQDTQISTNRRFISVYQITAATTALNATGTAGNAAWGAIVVTYKGGSSAATVTADTATATASGDAVAVVAPITQLADTASATASGGRVFTPYRAGPVIGDGVWTWYNDPRALTRNGATYIGFLKANGDACVAKLVHATSVVTAFTLHAALDVDDHANPALAWLPDGRLCATYSAHNDSAIRMRIATATESITAWGTETTLPNVTGVLGVSYANPWVLSSEGDRLYMMSRGQSFLPTITYSDDWDSATPPTWSTPRELFHGQGGLQCRPYGKYVSDGVSKLHFFFSAAHPTITAGRCHMYHWYYDAADGNFHTTDGTVIRSLASLGTTGELTESEVTKVYDATTNSAGGNGNAWPWSIELDASGSPVVAYSVFESFDDNRYHYARWTGSAWERHSILSNQGSLYGAGDTDEDEYAGGMVIDPDDTAHLYLVNDTSGQYELEQWQTGDGGATWSSSAITSGSSSKNARPTIPRGATDGGPRVLWWAGPYTTYTSYSTAVWAAPATAASPTSVQPTAIASAETIGTPTVVSKIAPTAIASAEAMGSPTLTNELHPSSIASAEAFGTPTVSGLNTIAPSGIASQAAVGTPVTTSVHNIFPTGIAGADQPGSPNVGTVTVGKRKTIRLNNKGIKSEAAVGTPRITGGRVTPSSIASQQALGTPQIVRPQVVAPTSIVSAESVPAVGVHRDGIGALDGIPSAEVVPAPLIVRAQTIDVSSIASDEAFGVPVLTTIAQTVAPVAIVSAEAVGSPVVLMTPAALHPVGITSGVAFGSPTLTGGALAPIMPTSIVSRQAFGLPLIIMTFPPGATLRRPNRLYNPVSGLSYAWAINHSEESPLTVRRQYEAGGRTTVGLSRQQAPGDPLQLTLRGTILDPAQKDVLDTFYADCDDNTLIYEDYALQAYEVIITSWEPRAERVARNPVTSGLIVWRFTIEMEVVSVIAGSLVTAGVTA